MSMRRGRQLLYEGWDLPNSTAFDPTRWSTTANTPNAGITINVQSGGGRFALAGVTGSYGEFGGVLTQRVLVNNCDFEIAATFTLSSAVAETYPIVAVGDAQFSGGAPTNGVSLEIQPSNSTYQIQRRDGGTSTGLVSGPYTYSAATAYRLKFRRESQMLSGQVWNPLTQSEDSVAWATIQNDPSSAYRSPDYSCILVGMFGGSAASATTVTFDDLTVYEIVDGYRRRKAVAIATKSPPPTGGGIHTALLAR